MNINTIYNEDCLVTMGRMPNNYLDMVLTSPPYDDLRKYSGYSFEFESVAKELYRCLKDGGCMVWVVGDSTKNGTESGTSFRQALYFKDIGFKLHDTMIFHKEGLPLSHKRYEQHFEYMFVFIKGSIKTFNGIRIPTVNRGISKYFGSDKCGSFNDIGKRGGKHFKQQPTKDTKLRGNIWKYPIGGGSADKEAFQHPAIFPEKLAADHILSWSNEGDLIYDPFMGSGTTAKMAQLHNRNYIGSEVSADYCSIATKRLLQVQTTISRQEDINLKPTKVTGSVTRIGGNTYTQQSIFPTDY